MSEHHSWSSLASLVSADDAVISSVRAFGVDPDAWFVAHADDLAGRRIDDPSRLTGIVVLVDACARAGQLAYLDWTSPVDDVVDLLGGLPRVAAAGVDLSVLIGPGRAAEADVETVVRWVNGLLAPAEVTAAILDEGSDAYPLVAVPTREVGTVVETARHLGTEVRVLRASAGDIADLLSPGSSPDAKVSA